MDITAAEFSKLFCKEKKNHLCKLPEVSLLKIIDYLKVDGILSLTLACPRLYVLYNGRKFFKRVTIRFKILDSSELKNFKDFLEKHQNYLSLNLKYFNNVEWNFLLPNIANIECISIQVNHLQDICMRCPNLRKLEICLNASNALLDCYTHLYRIDHYRHFRGQVDFTCLSKLHQLDKLVFKVVRRSGKYCRGLERCIAYEAWYLRPTVLFNILKSAKTIKKISFFGRFFICRRPKLKLEEAELIALKAIQKFVENENYLVSWDLRKICNDCREYTLMFPYTMVVVNCTMVALLILGHMVIVKNS